MAPYTSWGAEYVLNGTNAAMRFEKVNSHIVMNIIFGQNYRVRTDRSGAEPRDYAVVLQPAHPCAPFLSGHVFMFYDQVEMNIEPGGEICSIETTDID